MSDQRAHTVERGGDAVARGPGWSRETPSPPGAVEPRGGARRPRFAPAWQSATTESNTPRWADEPLAGPVVNDDRPASGDGADPRPRAGEGRRAATSGGGDTVEPGTAGYVRFLPPAHAFVRDGRSASVGADLSTRTTPAEGITSGEHRAHWGTVPLRTSIAVLVFLAMPGVVIMGLSMELALTLTLLVGVLGGGYLFGAWWRTSFALRGDHLVVRSGIVRATATEIPLSRLQAVDIVRPLAVQALGLAELRVELAGGDRSGIRLRYLSRRTAERLRASLLAHAAGLPGRTPEATERPFYTLPFGSLVGALAARLPVLAAFMVFSLLITVGVVFREPGVLGGAAPLLLGLLREFLGPLFRYTDFHAALSPDGLRLRYGVFQTRTQTVPPGRIQAVRIVEPLLWRSLGVARVEANIAGYVGERQMDSAVLLPVAPRGLAFALVDELCPGTDAAHVRLRPPKRGIPWGDALGFDTTVFVTRGGRLCQVLDIVPYARVQSVSMVAGPVSRWLGVATVQVEAVPGPARVRAAGRDLAEARDVVTVVSERARAVRARTVGPERWETHADPGEPDEPAEVGLRDGPPRFR